MPVDVEAPPASEIVTEEKMNAMMEKECAGASADLENKNPLCAIYGVDLSASGSRSSGSGQSRSPDRTFQPIEGK